MQPLHTHYTSHLTLLFLLKWICTHLNLLLIEPNVKIRLNFRKMQLNEKLKFEALKSRAGTIQFDWFLPKIWSTMKPFYHPIPPWLAYIWVGDKGV